MTTEDGITPHDAVNGLRRFIDGILEDSPRPRLLGCRIKEVGSIEETSLSLSHGFNVLYGKNGAGKSQIIDAVSYLASGGMTIASSESTLFFEMDSANCADRQTSVSKIRGKSVAEV